MHPLVAAKGGNVHLALETVTRHPVHFFTYRFNGKNINFFVRTDGNGEIRTHFDACYGCFKYKLGYVHEGNHVVCIACRIGYDLNDAVWDYVGACAPISLRSRVVGDKLLIRHSWLERGQSLF